MRDDPQGGILWCRWLLFAAMVVVLGAGAASGREDTDPIKLRWIEGDVGGLTPILSPDGRQTIGMVEFEQFRQGDRLQLRRVARFLDGSSDEDEVEARVGDVLTAVRGRSIIRDKKGTPTVDLTIDVAGGRVTGFSGLGKDREEYDEKGDIPAATYWGPLIFVVLKNFDANTTDDKLVFHTLVATPKPRQIDMEVTREASTTVRRPGGQVKAGRFVLRPTVNWLLDPIIQRLAPATTFFIHPGKPPALARFDGPRNYAGQKIRLQ